MPIKDDFKPAGFTTIAARRQIWLTASAINFRRKRIQFVASLISKLPQPLYVLDVGGMQDFWEKVGLFNGDVKLTLLNRAVVPVTLPDAVSVAGDARNMCEFADQTFDVAFSNAVIEHVGSFEQQHAMAVEMQRVAKRYIVQTPNRYFPIEPHVLIPFFQFFPLPLKLFLATHTPDWGWKAAHIDEIGTIRLLSEKELRLLFPGAMLYKEKFLGLTKSFILYKGW